MKIIFRKKNNSGVIEGTAIIQLHRFLPARPVTSSYSLWCHNTARVEWPAPEEFFRAISIHPGNLANHSNDRITILTQLQSRGKPGVVNISKFDIPKVSLTMIPWWPHSVQTLTTITHRVHMQHTTATHSWLHNGDTQDAWASSIMGEGKDSIAASL